MAYQDQFPTNWDTALIKPSFSFIQERNTNYHDPNMELMMNEQQCISASVNYYHPSLLENSNLSSTYQSITNNSTSYDSDLIIIQQQQQQQQEVVPEFHGKLLGNSGQMTDGNVENYNGSYKKRKTEDCGAGAQSSNLTCVSEMGTTARKNKQKSRKGKSKEKEEDKKSKEVVHVRARSGQATGSHSLAERVRREKINKKMKCLQDMVPGCYKSMGMATMLDEIINYVQSLQNQVEFLSMKLAGAAASTFYYDCYYNRSETELAMEKLQKQTQQEANKFLNGGCIDQQQAQEALALFHSSSTVWSN